MSEYTKGNKLFKFMSKYHYFLVSFLCLVVSFSAIWLHKYAVVVYLCLIIVASLFYDINKMIPLCCFSIFFLSLFNFYSEILIFFISITIITIKKLIRKEIYITKDWLIPSIAVSVLVIMFFTINFNFKYLKHFARTILAVIVFFECFLIRKDFNVLKITKHLVVLFTLSCVISLFFMLPNSSVNVIFVDVLGIKRYKGLMAHANTVGILAVILISLVLQFYIKKEINNLQFLVYCLPMVLAGICTKSKLFLLLSLMLFLVYVIFLFKENKKVCLIEVFIFILFLVIFNFCFENYFIQILMRFSGYFQTSSILDKITTGRISLWKIYLEKWSESIFTVLFGVGGTSNFGIYAHNEYIEILTRYGLLGFCLVFLVIYYICYKLRKYSNFKLLNYFAMSICLLTLVFDPLIHEKFILFVLSVLSIYNGRNEKKIDDNINTQKTKGIKNTILVSVIVPVYKVEQYLVRCIESIINQTYKNLEIILVNDGSPDECPKICDEYAIKDERIKVIHKVNGGLMDAWMTGLQNSSGEYVSFVDSDDWCELNMIEKLVSPVIEHQADLVIGNFYNAYNDYKVKVHGNKKLIIGLQEDENLEGIKKTCILKPNNFVPLYRWNKLFKKSLLIDNLKYCDKKIIFFEDACIVQSCILKSQKIYFIEDYVYNYYFRNESMIHRYTDNVVDLFILYYKKYTEMINELVDNDEERESGLIFENIRLVYVLGKIIMFNKIKDKNEKLKKLCLIDLVTKIDLKKVKKSLSFDRYLLARAYKKGNIFAIKVLHWLRELLAKFLFVRES